MTMTKRSVKIVIQEVDQVAGYRRVAGSASWVLLEVLRWRSVQEPKPVVWLPKGCWFGLWGTSRGFKMAVCSGGKAGRLRVAGLISYTSNWSYFKMIQDSTPSGNLSIASLNSPFEVK